MKNTKIIKLNPTHKKEKNGGCQHRYKFKGTTKCIWCGYDPNSNTRVNDLNK